MCRCDEATDDVSLDLREGVEPVVGCQLLEQDDDLVDDVGHRPGQGRGGRGRRVRRIGGVGKPVSRLPARRLGDRPASGQPVRRQGGRQRKHVDPQGPGQISKRQFRHLCRSPPEFGVGQLLEGLNVIILDGVDPAKFKAARMRNVDGPAEVPSVSAVTADSGVDVLTTVLCEGTAAGVMRSASIWIFWPSMQVRSCSLGLFQFYTFSHKGTLRPAVRGVFNSCRERMPRQ